MLYRNEMIKATKNFNFDMNGGVCFIGGHEGWKNNQAVGYEVRLQIGDSKRNRNGYDIYMTDHDVCISKIFMVKELPCRKYWTTNDRLVFVRYAGDIEFEEVLKQIINKDWMKRFNVNQSENNARFLKAFKKEMIRILEEKHMIVYGKAKYDEKPKYWETRLVEDFEIEIINGLEKEDAK